MLLFSSIAVTAGLVILQTTVFHHLSFYGMVPDLSLMAVVFLANQNGRIQGQSLGFAGGLIEDFLSLAPLGFHAFTKTLVGYLAGFSRGVVFTGGLVMPLLMMGMAGLFKILVSGLLTGVFSLSLGADHIFSWKTLAELAYNMALSPLVFALLRLLPFLKPPQYDR